MRREVQYMEYMGIQITEGPLAYDMVICVYTSIKKVEVRIEREGGGGERRRRKRRRGEGVE